MSPGVVTETGLSFSKRAVISGYAIKAEWGMDVSSELVEVSQLYVLASFVSGTYRVGGSGYPDMNLLERRILSWPCGESNHVSTVV